MVPRENKKNAYANFGGTNKECYGIFQSGLLSVYVPCTKFITCKVEGPYAFKKKHACRCAILDWCLILPSYQNHTMPTDFGNSEVRHRHCHWNRKVPKATSETKFPILILYTQQKTLTTYTHLFSLRLRATVTFTNKPDRNALINHHSPPSLPVTTLPTTNHNADQSITIFV